MLRVDLRRKENSSHVGCGRPCTVQGKARGTGQRHAQVGRTCSIAPPTPRGSVDNATAIIEVAAFADMLAAAVVC